MFSVVQVVSTEHICTNTWLRLVITVAVCRYFHTSLAGAILSRPACPTVTMTTDSQKGPDGKQPRRIMASQITSSVSVSMFVSPLPPPFLFLSLILSSSLLPSFVCLTYLSNLSSKLPSNMVRVECIYCFHIRPKHP